MIPSLVLAVCDMPFSEIDGVVESSSQKLLQISVPPVRYWLLRQVLSKDEEDSAVKRALNDCATYRPKQRLVEKMNADGTWPIPQSKRLAEEAGPGPPVGWTYRTMLWNLFMLSEYKASRSDSYIERSLRKILEWQTEDGYIPGPYTEVVPLPYYNGYALYLLTRFGLQKEKRVQKLSEWLLTMQRTDGGWSTPLVMDVHYTPEYRAMRMRDFFELVRRKGWKEFEFEKYTQYPSCPYSTMIVTWGLMQQPRLARSKAVGRGAEFVLDWFFKKSPHPSYYMTEDHWTRLRYPYRFGSGLMALDMLTQRGYGPDNQRMERPIKWLLDARSSDGFWSQSERPHPERDQWITLIALRILRRYSDTRE